MTFQDLGLPWPADGECIWYRRRTRSGTEEGVGIVRFVWTGIEPAIKLESGIDLFPTLGDEWGPRADREGAR